MSSCVEIVNCFSHHFMAILRSCQVLGVDATRDSPTGSFLGTKSSRITSGGCLPEEQVLPEDGVANSWELHRNRLQHKSPDSFGTKSGNDRLRHSQHNLLSGDSSQTIAVAERTGPGGTKKLWAVGPSRQAEKCQRLCSEGQLDKALDVLVIMDEQCEVPPENLYRCLLKACVKSKALAQARQVHGHLAKHGLESSNLGEDVVSALVKCGGLEDALPVFQRLPHRTVLSWTALISGYTTLGQGQEALKTYRRMLQRGVKPDKYTFVALLRAAGSIPDLDEGKFIHAEVSKYRYESDLFVGTCLVDMYGKCGSIVDAQNVFDGLSGRDVVTWNAMLTAYVQQGQADKALQLYDHMREEGAKPTSRTFVATLQACSLLAEKEIASMQNNQMTKVKALKRGKAVHADALREGHNSDLFLGSTLVSMFGKCGSIVDAQNVFNGLSKRNVVSWNSLLAAYAQQGQALKVLELYEQMKKEGISSNDRTFVTVLQACGILAEEEVVVEELAVKLKALQLGREIHHDARRKNYDSNVFVGNTLVCMYRKCGSLVDAESTFQQLSERDVVSWRVMLTAYAQQGQAHKALRLYQEMKAEGVSMDVWTFVSALQACAILAEKPEDANVDVQFTKVDCLEQGKVIHADADKEGHGSNTFVCNTLISMYGKCGSIVLAQQVFDSLLQREVVSWNAILNACAQQDATRALLLYEQMLEEGVTPDEWSFVSTIQACCLLAEVEQSVLVNGQLTKVKSAEKGKAIHFEARKKGYDSDIFVGNTLVSMYGKCGSILLAQQVFDGLSRRDLVSWNVMLMICVQQSQAGIALQLYEQMREEGISPDVWTYVSSAQACGMLAQTGGGLLDGRVLKSTYLTKGKTIHAEAWRNGYQSDLFLGCTLIGMYGKCASMLDSLHVFHTTSHQSEVAWAAVLSAFVELGQGESALHLYEAMQEEDVSPDERTFVSILQACGMIAETEADGFLDGQAAKIKCLKIGRCVHADVCRRGYESDAFLICTLISMYAKCGRTADAQLVFDRSSTRSVVTWNSMLSGYVEQGEAEKALQLYRQMQKENLSPDDVTLVLTLQASGVTGSLDMCRHIHHAMTLEKKTLSPLLATTLIHAYGRCASMADAQTVFQSMAHADVISWNALIAGYARDGQFAAILQSFGQMRRAGANPDEVTFLSLLSACSYAGLVDEGVEYFESMSRDYGLTPEIDHYVCLVDLLGRAGHCKRVQELLSVMPVRPNLAMLLSQLGACRKHGEVVLGKQAFDCAIHLQQEHPAAYLLMSNIYANFGLWERSKEVMEARQLAGVKKKLGQSWIEHENRLHSFLVGDADYPQAALLCELANRR